MFAQESGMDLQKEREAFEKECRLLCYKGNMVMSNLGSFYNNEQTNWMWQMWLSAKAQAVPEWISVEDKLPETEPNTDGVVCAVVCSLGNVYRARYMHDVDIGVDTKYWSEFAVNYNGREYEHYEINAKISHWIPLPDAPQEPANE